MTTVNPEPLQQDAPVAIMAPPSVSSVPAMSVIATVPMVGIPSVIQPVVKATVPVFKCSGMTASRKQCGRCVVAEGARCWQHPAVPVVKPVAVVAAVPQQSAAPLVQQLGTLNINPNMPAVEAWVNAASIGSNVHIVPHKRTVDIAALPEGHIKWATGPFVLKICVGDNNTDMINEIKFNEARDYTLGELCKEICAMYAAPLSAQSIEAYIEASYTAALATGVTLQNEDGLHTLHEMVEEEGYAAAMHELHFERIHLDRIVRDINEDAAPNTYVLLLRK